MKAKYKPVIREAVISVIGGAAIFCAVYALCRYKTAGLADTAVLAERTVLYSKVLAGAVGFCGFFWIMSVLIRIREKKEAASFREDMRNRAQNFSYRSAAATLFDVIDDNRSNKSFFTMYGDSVRSGEEPSALYMLIRMFALIFTFLTVSFGFVIVCAFLSLTV